MQNKYTGDIGDFGKYGLLRVLTAPGDSGVADEQPLPLGIVWYLMPDGGNPGDGRQTRYLLEGNRTGRQLRKCDAGLHETLGAIVTTGQRQVGRIAHTGILPDGTRYHGEPADFRTLPRQRGQRIAEVREHAREVWQEAALEETRDCGLVLLDPDNGLAPDTMTPGSLGAGQYAFHNELRGYIERGQSLVVYHHLNRSQRAIRQIYGKQLEIYERFRMRSLAMRFHRGSPRVFLVIPQRQHREYVTHRIRTMLQGPWGKHFSMIG